MLDVGKRYKAGTYLSLYHHPEHPIAVYDAIMAEIAKLTAGRPLSLERQTPTRKQWRSSG